MQLLGLNKLTLLDYPGHLACTVFTGACNFRCPYCHNAPLVLSSHICPVISEEDFFDFLSTLLGKLEGVCITGGEPTLQPDLPEFIYRIKELGFLVKLDTNGYRPEILKTLLGRHLPDMVAMDIKNTPASYAKTAGLSENNFSITPIEESIRLILSSGISHEFRTTAAQETHPLECFSTIGQWLSDLGKPYTGSTTLFSPFYLQNFKDSGNLVCGDGSQFHPLTEDQLQNAVSLLQSYLPNAKRRGEPI